MFELFKERGVKQPEANWANITLAYMYLKDNSKSKAFDIARSILSNNPRDEQKNICNDLISHEFDQDIDIPIYINNIVLENKKYMKIERW